MNDPAFVAELRRGNIELNPIGGKELTAIVASTIGISKSAIDRYQAAIAAE
jgi:hypothetical protein